MNPYKYLEKGNTPTFRKMYVEWHLWHCSGHQGIDDGTQKMRKGNNTQNEEVTSQQQVDVNLLEYLEEHVEAEKCHRCNQRKIHSILLCHCVRFLASRL